MSELGKIILASAGFSAMFSGAIIWLFKSWISERLKNAIAHEYAQKLETHKAQLKAQSDVEIEKLKSELQIAASERNIKLTKVFEEQADIIAAVYAKLIALRDAVDNYIGFMREIGSNKAQDTLEKMHNAHREFGGYFYPRRIYIPVATANKITELEISLGRVFKLRSWEF